MTLVEIPLSLALFPGVLMVERVMQNQKPAYFTEVWGERGEKPNHLRLMLYILRILCIQKMYTNSSAVRWVVELFRQELPEENYYLRTMLIVLLLSPFKDRAILEVRK